MKCPLSYKQILSPFQEATLFLEVWLYTCNHITFLNWTGIPKTRGFHGTNESQIELSMLYKYEDVRYVP